MERRAQFSLSQLFAQLTLIAGLIGAARLVYLYAFGPNDLLHCLVGLPAMCAMPVLAGAVVGGWHGDYRFGALVGTGILAAVILLILLFGPRVQ